MGFLERLRTTGAPGTRAESLALGVTGGAPIELAARSTLMLPVDIRPDGAALRWATAELDGAG
ncbi:hypothetical protein [Streptomyces sp. NBC_00316]|uniref:hypothetical protein n=1 Tax=Streptomyces sp. NBC_00316 TaxID=2975710 RepID=UPI002E29F7AD|nr:hypothetical protein [Streptomyces sp. NBC_00316]